VKTALLRFLPVAALAVITCGCEQKLTYERFQTIRDGDSHQVVEATLGEPWMRSIGDQTWVYQDQHQRINASVYFQDAKVVGKRWCDPSHGIQGTPSVSQPGESHQIEMREIR
jgi:hypothetical protein